MKNNVCISEGMHKCTGCGMCAACCPRGAITINENDDGFYRPFVDDAKCVDCGFCTKVCYCFDGAFSVKEKEEYVCFSAANRTEEELRSSSSGAVSIELMRECLAQGYYVLGVAYDYEKGRAITKIAKNASELEQFKGSKYFQSYTAEAFRQVIEDKSEQKYAVFGTPCQIYAFSKMAEVRQNRHKYVLVDIFCHGCPSLRLWDKYLGYIKGKHRIKTLDHIGFRSKSHGWHEYCFDFAGEKKKITSSKYADPFYELFFTADMMNDACIDCIARSTVEKTDIRLGDFWGKRYNADAKGVSAVVIATETGQKLFSRVREKFCVETADFYEIISGQSYKKTHSSCVNARKEMFDSLRGPDGIKKIVRKNRKRLPLRANVKRILKRVLKHLPVPLYVKIKNKLT